MALRSHDWRAGYARDQARRKDLLQDIHVALRRSLVTFDGRCTLRTWAYRVSHDVGIKHLIANKRPWLSELHTLEELSELPDQKDNLNTVEHEDSGTCSH